MTTPFKPRKPNTLPTAREYNRLQDLAEWASKLTASPPLELIRSPDGPHLRLGTPPSIWVKITGKELSDEDAEPPGWHYSGVQQLDSSGDPATSDFTTGLNFLADTFPLVEVNEDDGIETDGSVIVRAWIGLKGDYYTFDGGSGAGRHDNIHVVGQPRVVDSRRWYNGRVSLTNATTHAKEDGAEVWLLQEEDAELATNGQGRYNAVRRPFTMTIDDETRPVYETDQMMWLYDAFCDEATGKVKVVRHGTFGGDLEAGSGYSSEGGDHFVSEGGDGFILET